ncbi:MAG: hypothetical protein G5Z42_01115 [Caldisphaeraceae archaeon]|nr:hypothetical protein [Caldisphaeraceae archaeon]MEB3797404.1 hypothetical protein [Caldisphaeraceae archaeon]
MKEILAFIGIDDTDTRKGKVSGAGKGTGRVAREAAKALLNAGYRVLWVLRHQMLKSERISTPGNNSSKSVTLEVKSREEAERALRIVTDVVRKLAAPNSNAGLALLIGVPPSGKALHLAMKAKKEFVSLDEVLRVANACDIHAIKLLGNGSGIIGAFAAAVLASTGNDGRVLDIPSTGIRELKDEFVLVKKLLDLGVAEVRSLDGVKLSEHEVVALGKAKPVLRKFKPVLYVKRVGLDWLAVKVE